MLDVKRGSNFAADNLNVELKKAELKWQKSKTSRSLDRK